MKHFQYLVLFFVTLLSFNKSCLAQTFQEQLVCSEKAERYITEIRRDLTENQSSNYKVSDFNDINHFDKKTQRCFVLYSYFVFGEINHRHKTLVDVLEKKWIGEFNEHTDSNKNWNLNSLACYVGTNPKIVCSSENEFDELAKKFIGD